MKKNLDTGIALETADEIAVFASIEAAMGATGLTKRQLEVRATSMKTIKGVLYRWTNPSTRRSYLGKRSRTKGNSWEREIVNNLKKIGYDGCVSSRSESKRTDDAKVDIIDINNELPCYIQAKNTKNLPNYHKIEKECPLKDKPFVIACKQASKMPIIIMPIDFFYDLIKKRRECS